MRRHTITLALATALFVTAAASAADDIIRKGFNVADGGTLRLDADIGDVKIVTGGNGVAIEVVREARGRRGQERLREHRIDFRQSGNDVIISSDDDDDHDWFRWSDDYEVQWNIRIPARYNVEVKTSGGGIELADIGGTVDARTSGGGIRTGKLSGDATLKTSGGSIRVGGLVVYHAMAKTKGAEMTEINAKIASGAWRYPLNAPVPLDKVAETFADFEARKLMGRTIFEVGGEV